jgi:16S rRNA (cytosine967-C5)-methyltransferase
MTRVTDYRSILATDAFLIFFLFSSTIQSNLHCEGFIAARINRNDKRVFQIRSGRRYTTNRTLESLPIIPDIFKLELEAHICDDNNDQWEERMRQMSTDALLPVLYPAKIDTKTRARGNPTCTTSLYKSSATFLDAEKALKKMLRRYQQSLSEEDSSFEERQKSRKRMADLVLGTGLMRIRHWHYYKWKNQIKSKDCEPIFGLSSTNLNSAHDCCDRGAVVRAMVDLHADYMIHTDDGEKDEIQSMDFDSDAERISIVYSLPRFFIDMLIDQYGLEITEKTAKIFNKSGPITIRRNEIKCASDKELCERLLRDNAAIAVPLEGLPGKERSIFIPNGCLRLVINDSWSPSTTSIWSMQAWKNGWFEVQDAGSQLIVKATEANYDDVVVDYCAGNGGKTFALASQMHERRGESDIEGSIIAHDIVEDRLRQLKGSFERTGISAEGAISVSTTIDQGIHLEAGMADIVLVDAPCSSTGVLRRRPSHRFKLKGDEIMHQFPEIQLKVLKEASNLVKPRGKLVYATCSILKFENEDVVEKFESQSGFSSTWEPWAFDTLEDEENAILNVASLKKQVHCRQLLPAQYGSDGFFIARWRRLE